MRKARKTCPRRKSMRIHKQIPTLRNVFEEPAKYHRCRKKACGKPAKIMPTLQSLAKSLPICVAAAKSACKFARGKPMLQIAREKGANTVAAVKKHAKSIQTLKYILIHPIHFIRLNISHFPLADRLNECRNHW
jgi:UV DNA damage repair endonuclease